MRLYLSILAVSLALYESDSQASKVRGTAAFNRTTEAADNEHGLSLLPTTMDEDRMFKVFKNTVANVIQTPDVIVKKRLEKLIPNLGESSSSSTARRPTNVQGLKTLSDQQKVQLGMSFIYGNSLQELLTAVRSLLRKGGKDEMDAIFSALCKHLGKDVMTKVVMNVEMTRERSAHIKAMLKAAQFKYWQKNGKSYADVFKSLRKLENEEEQRENFGRNAKKLDEFIKFLNNGEPNDESLFTTLTRDDCLEEFAAFISEGKSNPHLLKKDAIELEKRYFNFLTHKQMTVGDLFDTLKMQNDGTRMFIGPKFDLMTGYAARHTQQQVFARIIIGVYREKLGMKDLVYWLARAAAEPGETNALKENAKYLTNLLFKYFLESDDEFEALIRTIETEGGTNAANFLMNFRSAYKQNVKMSLRGFKDPFKSRASRQM